MYYHVSTGSAVTRWRHLAAAVILAFSMVSALAPPATADQLKKAWQAYKAGDYATAWRIYQPLAEGGDAKAQALVGAMYRYGQGVAQNYSEAAKWYGLAAEQGIAGAQFLLGYLHHLGQGVTRDYSEAAHWYRKSAQQGLAIAQASLGYMHDNGHGVARDYPEAAKWYLKAAKQGFAAAQMKLGRMYYHGLGVSQDYVQAHKWFNIASAAGNETSRKNRDVVVDYMTTGQIAEAQELAKKWLKRHPKKTKADGFSPWSKSPGDKLR